MKITKTKLVFFDKSFQGKHTGYIIFSSIKKDINKTNKIQMNASKLYYSNTDFNYKKCIHLKKGLLSLTSMTTQFSDKNPNIEFETSLIYSIPNKFNLYLIFLPDFSSQLIHYKSDTILNQFSVKDDGNDIDVFESIIQFNKKHSIKTEIKGVKDNINMNMFLEKIYKAMIGKFIIECL
jgi:hypothetical protein